MSGYMELRSIFQASVKQTLENLSDENAVRVRARLIDVVGGWTAPYLLSGDNFNEKSDEVFADEVFRDWLFNTRFVFFTNAGFAYGQSMVGFVLDMLARNASLDLGIGPEFNLTPEELEELSGMPDQFPQSILNYDQAKELIAANNWVVPILLSIAFISLDDEVLKTPAPNNNQN